MKEYIKKFLDKWLCMHQWESLFTVHVEKDTDYGKYQYKVKQYVCKKCVKFKRIEAK